MDHIIDNIGHFCNPMETTNKTQLVMTTWTKGRLNGNRKMYPCKTVLHKNIYVNSLLLFFIILLFMIIFHM